MIQIQLQPEFEAQLASEAQARGITLDRYIAEKLETSRSATLTREHSLSQAIGRIRALRKGNLLGDLKIRDLIQEGRLR